MSFEQNLFFLVSSIAASGLATYGVVRWRRAKGPTSVFAQDAGLEEVGLSALSSLFSKKATDLGDGRSELRPTWGIRLIAPLIAIALLIAIDLGALWTSIGVHSQVLQSLLFILIAFALGYSWFMLLFVQRVIYDQHHVTCFGIDLRQQTRRLADLVDIHVHDKRPALVLTFSDQNTLYLPKFLSDRDRFIESMEQIAAENMNNGMVQPLPRWQERLAL